MQEEPFDYTIVSSRTGADAAAAVEDATAENGYRVLHVHDVAATLAEKGFEREPMRIVEVCNAKHAHAVLSADPRIALMLPCRIAVWAEGGRTKVGTVLPTVISAFYPDAGIGPVAEEVERVLKAIVDAAA